MRASLMSMSCLATMLAAQDPQPASDYLRALDRALEREQSANALATDIWEDHSTWENAWRVTSDRYEVRTQHSYALGRDLADGLEAMAGHFRSVLGKGVEGGGRRQIYVFPDIAAYNQFSNSINATEHSSFYGSFHALQHADRPVATVYDRNRVWLRIQVTHSAVHQWLRLAFPSATPPVWIEEGLAAYFSLYWHPQWARDELRKMVDGDRLIPLGTLLNDALGAYATRTQERMIELGMLFNYLLNYRDDTKTIVDESGKTVSAPFRDYLVGVLNGRDPTDVPEQFGDLAALQAAFRACDFGAK